MKHSLSILIPTYNQVCIGLARALSKQACAIGGLQYEIVVADDGSTDDNVVRQNKAIDAIEGCRYVVNGRNVGRAAVRNRLGQMARHTWLLFMDCDVEIQQTDFLEAYLHAPDDYSVAYGGLSIGWRGDAGAMKANLRYKYEKACEPHHTAAQRMRHPHRSFRTTCFMVRRDVFLSHPFDPSITTYGYEDVLFGKSLHDDGIAILHMDNPVTYTEYEPNDVFVAKTEEALRTLSQLSGALAGYSGVLSLCEKLRRMRLDKLCLAMWNKKKDAWRGNLVSKHPSLLVFKLYKMGYFMSVHTHP